MLIPNKRGMMTYEQVGYILTLGDILSEYEEAHQFTLERHEYKEAESMIESMEDRITSTEYGKKYVREAVNY